MAVREYGQRLAYALHGFEQQAAAEESSDRWDATWGFAPNLARRLGPGIALGLVADYAAIALDRDGTFENGPDLGPVLDEEDAVGVALRGRAFWPSAEVSALAAEARGAFDHTLKALGRPKPPLSPPIDWLEPLENIVVGIAVDQVGDVIARTVQN